MYYNLALLYRLLHSVKNMVIYVHTFFQAQYGQEILQRGFPCTNVVSLLILKRILQRLLLLLVRHFDIAWGHFGMVSHVLSIILPLSNIIKGVKTK